MIFIFLPKVYSNIGESVYVDLVYDITYNTLFASEETVCDKRMDKLFDVTLYQRINEDLDKKFNCRICQASVNHVQHYQTDKPAARRSHYVIND